MNNRSIKVKGTDVAISSRNDQDYISLTDMVKRFGDESILYSWLRNRNTIEFLGIWEQIYNPDFKPLEFERFKSQAGLNVSRYRRRNGSKPPQPSAFMLKREEVVAPTLTKT